jgi:hypothetical protein
VPTAEEHSHNPLVRYFKLLGPGLVTGASDDDPGGITTYSVAPALVPTNDNAGDGLCATGSTGLGATLRRDVGHHARRA